MKGKAGYFQWGRSVFSMRQARWSVKITDSSQDRHTTLHVVLDEKFLVFPLCREIWLVRSIPPAGEIKLIGLLDELAHIQGVCGSRQHFKADDLVVLADYQLRAFAEIRRVGRIKRELIGSIGFTGDSEFRFRDRLLRRQIGVARVRRAPGTTQYIVKSPALDLAGDSQPELVHQISACSGHQHVSPSLVIGP